MTTAFVLSGGANLGAVQVGMLRALHEAGIRPDLPVGASVGAINAAWVAGAPPDTGVDELAAIWTSMRHGDVFPLRLGLGLARRRPRRRHHLRARDGRRVFARARADLGAGDHDAPRVTDDQPPPVG